MLPHQPSHPLPLSNPPQFPIGDAVAINGTVFALVQTEGTYTVGNLVEDPTWVECEAGKTVEWNGIQAQILLGDWEGEGGLRLANSVSEVILHFDASESFQDLQLFPDRLQAFFDDYPKRGAYEVHFQVDTEFRIQVKKITRQPLR